MKAFKYVSPNPAPQGYQCSKCGAFGCKLWRQSHVFLDSVQLLCAECATKDDPKLAGIVVDDDGMYLDPEMSGRTDQVAGLVPAVPTEDGDTFWGYSAVPEIGVMWWRALPTKACSAWPCTWPEHVAFNTWHHGDGFGVRLEDINMRTHHLWTVTVYDYTMTHENDTVNTTLGAWSGSREECERWCSTEGRRLVERNQRCSVG